MKQDLREAHGHSANHRDEILRSTVCGCFYCLSIFKPHEIVKWCDFYKDAIGEESYGHTALCPKCGIDSVIGSASGYPINFESLKSMKEHWF